MDKQLANSILTKAEQWILNQIFGHEKAALLMAALVAQGWIAH